MKDSDIERELKNLSLEQEPYDKELANMTSKLINPVDIRRYRDTVNIFLHGKNAKILDVGCWPCALDLILKKKGFDISGTGLDVSKKFKKSMSANEIKILKCNLDSDILPFKNRKFDCVLCTEVIEHMQNPYHLLSEANRVLKKNGRLVLSTPNAASLNKIFKILSGNTPYGQSILFWFEPKESYFKREKHFREYTISELEYMLNKFNFRIERAYFSDCGDLRIKNIGKLPYSMISKIPAWLLSLILRKLFPRLNSEIIIDARKINP